MYDWTRRGRGPYTASAATGPTREALYAALQRAREDNHRLRDRASAEIERLQDENSRLRRHVSAHSHRQAAISADEAEALRQRLQQAEAEAEALHAANARLRAEVEAAQAAPPAPPQPQTPPPAADEERLRRLMADMANLRRRQGEELERARRAARAELVRDFVEALDSLEQALDTLPAEDSPWRAGILGVQRQLLSTLRRAGVAPVGAAGEAFDPRQHEAVGMTDASGLAADHIVTVVRPGYRFVDSARADALIRPARVIVSAT